MKAYAIRIDKPIKPFNEPARDCLVLNQTIADVQAEIFGKAGMEIVSVSDASKISDTNEYLVLGDNLFFTPELLNEFVERSRQGRDATVCALNMELLRSGQRLMCRT